MGSMPKTEPLDGLGNHVYLEKQDKLREIGVDIPTSQVCKRPKRNPAKTQVFLLTQTDRRRR
jgi:hypothetical protein